MDRNSITGFILIFLIFTVWQYMTAPTAAEIEAQKIEADSLRQVFIADSIATLQKNQPATTAVETIEPQISDSAKVAQAAGRFGIFAPVSFGKDELFNLENDLMVVTFSSRGGKVKEVTLKEHFKILEDSTGAETKVPVVLLEDAKNKFEYLLPTTNGKISTEDLYFKAEQGDNSIVFSATTSNGKVLQQKYTLSGGYLLDYSLDLNGLQNDLSGNNITLNWINYLDKLELNTAYERIYSTLYYKEADDDPTYCSCTSDDEENLEDPVKWVSSSNQFFNSTLIADQSFRSADLTATMIDEGDMDLKKLSSRLSIPVTDGSVKMQFYNGPNEFERLRAIGHNMEDIVPFGWSIFGTINRWVIRPLFNFLSSFVASKGIVILLLTVLVKLALFPFTYKMIHSQSKMAVLKPEIAKLRDKYKDDAQQIQVETMKMYREYGVNPLGGCFPVLLQMPIWFALYRFFPGSIEFRQESFLWASDLSSFDVFARLPFEIPAYGAHVSMFTLLWAVLTLVYTWYNSRLVDYSAQPAMKYMQYGMPVMFLFFFNNFASGLTAYLCMSTFFNIGQTILTKEVLINSDKLKDKLNENKKKPKKKSGFQQRLEEAMKEQQKLQKEKKKGGKGKKKK